MICAACRTELSPSASICPGCGARRDPGSWRDQVRESVARHRDKKRSEQEQRVDDSRQLTIFPKLENKVAPSEPTEEGNPEERELKERRAAIRARVQERVSRRATSPVRPIRESRFSDAGEIPLGQGKAATARELTREPEEEEIFDPRAERFSTLPLDEPDPKPSFAEPELEQILESSAGLGLGAATAGDRLLAGMIDLFFVGLIQLTLFYLTTHLVAQRVGALPRSALVSMGLVGAVLGAGYFLFFWSLSGQTLGKLLTGSRVVDRRGRALGFGRAALRLAGTLVAAIPFGAGFIGLWTDPERRGWHDRIAGSKVVRG
jgi:uncharacterized RDD family membrane protein YckC